MSETPTGANPHQQHTTEITSRILRGDHTAILNFKGDPALLERFRDRHLVTPDGQQRPGYNHITAALNLLQPQSDATFPSATRPTPDPAADETFAGRPGASAPTQELKPV